MDKHLKPEEDLKLIQNKIKLEYLYEDIWFPLWIDSPIRLLWEYKIRVKEQSK